MLAGSRAKLSRTSALGGGGGKKSVKLVPAVKAEITRFFAVCGSEKARVDKDSIYCISRSNSFFTNFLFVNIRAFPILSTGFFFLLGGLHCFFL
jgi:nitrate reductase NapE component